METKDFKLEQAKIRLERSQLRFAETYGYGTEAVRAYEADKRLIKGNLMGLIRHDCMVFTSDNCDRLVTIRIQAIKLGLQVTGIIKGVNDICSFLVAPDGGHEGKPRSNEADIARETLTKMVRDSKMVVNWFHVAYGGDIGSTIIMESSDDAS